MHHLAPIILFTYKRLDTLKKTVAALQNNTLAPQSDLIIFSDGAKKEEDNPVVEGVRNYLRKINGFKSVTINESPINKGLASSIIIGVSEVITKYKKVIVLEDDLITSTNFLEYMNQALMFYQNNPNILSICGYSPVIKGLNQTEVYFTQRSSSWGWACWEDRWMKIDWSVKSYSSFAKSYTAKRCFNKMGSDMSLMMKRQMEGKINSWAIKFCFHQFQHQLYSVHPAVSKIENIGFAEDNATNTIQKFSRFKSNFYFSSSNIFDFKKEIKLEGNIISQFVKVNSIKNRIINKLINFIR